MKKGLQRNRVMFTLVLALLLLASVSALEAQEAPQPKAGVSDADLKAFAKAYVKVDKIRLAYEPSLQSAQGPAETLKIQQDAKSKMEKAIAEEGLTAETYTQIFSAVKDDDELREKTIDLIDAERQNP